MSIVLEKKPSDKFKGIVSPEQLIEEGFDITLESGELDPEEPTWYCSLYYGDSNAPWKTGTCMGEGEGQTIQEAVKTAIDSLEEVTGYHHKKVNPRTSFAVFLADWKE